MFLTIKPYPSIPKNCFECFMNMAEQNLKVKHTAYCGRITHRVTVVPQLYLLYLTKSLVFTCPLVCYGEFYT